MVVHQMGSVLCYGDAITNAVAALDRRMTAWGLTTRVYGANIEAARMPKAELDTAYRDDSPDDLLIYHYSAYCENYQLFRQSRHRKVLVYHNITPAHFYRPYDPFMEAVCSQGRAVLPLLRECEVAVGVSEYNRRELVEAGFPPERTAVLPILLDPAAFASVRRDERLYRHLVQSQGTKLLFVGRVAPNKAHQDLLSLLAAYREGVDPYAHLYLVGARFLPRYDAVLDRLARRLGVAEGVTFTDRVSQGELKAYYEAGSVFTCASQHEGLCVPLLEAMGVGLPILARAAAAVPDTLGEAGVLYREADYGVLAEMVGLLVEEGGLRAKLVEGGRERLADFAPDRVAAQWRGLLVTLGVPLADRASLAEFTELPE